MDIIVVGGFYYEEVCVIDPRVIESGGIHIF